MCTVIPHACFKSCETQPSEAGSQYIAPYEEHSCNDYKQVLHNQEEISVTEWTVLVLPVKELFLLFHPQASSSLVWPDPFHPDAYWLWPRETRASC